MKRSLIALSGIWMLFALPGVAKADLLINGDFSQVNTGFSSQYSFVPGNGSVFTQPGNYSVISNPVVAFSNPYASFGDHTTGSGLMLFADGTGAGTNVWSENVSVNPGTYTFSGWVANGDPALINPAMLALFLNGNEIGSPFTISQLGGVWQEWITQMNFPASALIVLSIQDVNPNPRGTGNDYAIDDLSLTTVQVAATPEPSSLLLTESGLVITILTLRRKLLRRRAWTYSDPFRRIPSNKLSATGH